MGPLHFLYRSIRNLSIVGNQQNSLEIGTSKQPSVEKVHFFNTIVQDLNSQEETLQKLNDLGYETLVVY